MYVIFSVFADICGQSGYNMPLPSSLCVRAFLQVFVRGGLLLVVADSPQRPLMLYCKHPNSSTIHPCPYCLVSQTGDDGGDLGDPKYDIEKNRRTRGQIMRARRELKAMASTVSAQTTRSKDLGVVAPDVNQRVWPLHDLIKFDAVKACPVESLHACALVSHVVFVPLLHCYRS